MSSEWSLPRSSEPIYAFLFDLTNVQPSLRMLEVGDETVQVDSDHALDRHD